MRLREFSAALGREITYLDVPLSTGEIRSFGS